MHHAGVLLCMGLFVAGLGAYIWRARPESSVHRWFGAYTLCMAVWAMAIAALQLVVWPSLASRFAFASASLMPACFLAFTRVYPDARDCRLKASVSLALGFGAGLAACALFTELLVYDVHVVNAELRRTPGILYPSFVVYFLTVWLAGLVTFIGKWQQARGLARVQLQHLGIGLIISGGGAITTNLLIPALSGSSAYSGFGPYFLVPMVVLVAHAIVRHRLLDLRPVIHHGLALGIGILALSTAVGVTVRQGGVQSLEVPAALVITVAVAAVVFSAPIYPALRRIIDRYLLSEQIDFEQTLVEATYRLTRVMPRSELSAEIIKLVRAAVQPGSITLLMIDVSGDRWIVLHREHTGTHLEAALDESWTLGTKCGPGVRLLEAYAGGDGTATRELRAAGVEVWMGLGREQVVGVLLLGPRQTRPEYFAQQLKFLEALGPIIAAALEIEILHERQLELERARAREAHLAQARAESLATFQRMTQALAHEIGNPLTPIKALAKILPERQSDSAFAENFSRIVAREVERIERLVSRLRRVAPHAEASFTDLDLRAPMRHALEVIEAAAINQGTRLEVSLPQIVPVTGDIGALEELFLNLLTNALEAVAQQSEARRRIEVAAAISDGFAVAEVRDSGPGISVAHMDKIFDPFVTTKPRGSGLGLAICSAIADHHHGRIVASNVDDGGALFTVTLPLAPGRPLAEGADLPLEGT